MRQICENVIKIKMSVIQSRQDPLGGWTQLNNARCSTSQLQIRQPRSSGAAHVYYIVFWKAVIQPKLRGQLNTRQKCTIASRALRSTNTEKPFMGPQGHISLYVPIYNLRNMGNRLKKQQDVRGTVAGILSPSLVSLLWQIKESE